MLARRILAITTCFGVVWSQANAQETAAQDPLALPTQIMMCRSLPTTPADSGASALQFVDGADPLSSGRRIGVAYDSLGAPRFLLVLAPHGNMSGGGYVRAVAVRFGQPEEGYSGVLGEAASLPDNGQFGSTDLRQRIRLTEAEVSQARELARWLWARRCGRPDGGN